MNPFWSNYPEISDELDAVLEIIRQVNQSSEEHLNESVDYLTATGGKMLRPALFMMGSRFGPEADAQKKQSLLTLAAAIENLHLATLIHDDVVDESRLRRGKETIQSRYGKEFAVYMGDYLLCQCFLMLSDHAYDKETLKVLSTGVSKVCLGEIRQYQNRHNPALSLREYKKIIAGKTAALFAVSLFSGAREAGAEEGVTKTLARIGYCVGMAFQIIDDLLDYQGETSVFGKDTLIDLQKGYFTLPLIVGMQGSAGREIREILERAEIKAEDAGVLSRLLKESAAMEVSERSAAAYTRRALNYVKRLPEGPGRTLLEETLPRLLTRRF